jgi:hypothetical protein
MTPRPPQVLVQCLTTLRVHNLASVPLVVHVVERGGGGGGADGEGSQRESRRRVIESPWVLLTSECQRFGHPPRLNQPPVVNQVGCAPSGWRRPRGT